MRLGAPNLYPNMRIAATGESMGAKARYSFSPPLTLSAWSAMAMVSGPRNLIV